ncbi:MAG: serine hydrolase, partial [Calditrichaeota bacterium]|nr:serine hydrolase [Calditrichota bacterium]
PIGMTRSDYTPLPEVSARLATGYMWTYEGRVFPAPTFQLGMVPAAGMYATVNDLGQFMKMLIRHGQGEEGILLQPETLEKMWQIQYADAGQQYGFGLGFYVSKFHEYRQVRHGGVMYGYATQIAVLPEARLGAVTIITNDCANIVAGRINDYAFELLLAKQAGKPLPEFRPPAPPDSQTVQTLAGSYHSGEEIVDLEARDGRLYAFYANERNRLMQFGDTLLLDDRLSYGHSFLPQADGSLLIDGVRFQRRPEMLPPPPPPRWEGLIGEYGWDHNTLYILEKHGRLYALIEWFFFYPLEEISPDVYAFPDYGLYHGEQLIFTRDEQGIATQVEAASVVFRRRPAGLSGDTFRIDPQQPLETLRAAALKARPPAESGDFLTPDLVEVQS